VLTKNGQPGRGVGSRPRGVSPWLRRIRKNVKAPEGALLKAGTRHPFAPPGLEERKSTLHQGLSSPGLPNRDGPSGGLRQFTKELHEGCDSHVLGQRVQLVECGIPTQKSSIFDDRAKKRGYHRPNLRVDPKRAGLI